MSILVKDMKMPTSCYDCNCFIRDSDGSDYCCLLMQDIEDNDKRDDDCPLVPVPEHGDLIDRDEQIERAWRLKLSTRELIEEMLKSAPTIIPADDPKEE